MNTLPCTRTPPSLELLVAMGTCDTAKGGGRRKDPRAPCQMGWRVIAGPVLEALLRETASVITASICTLSLASDRFGQAAGETPGCSHVTQRLSARPRGCSLKYVSTGQRPPPMGTTQPLF